MRIAAIVGLVLGLGIAPVLAQEQTIPGTLSACPAALGGGFCWQAYVGERGHVNPLGFQQITSLSGAVKLTIPTGAVEALIICTGQPVAWRDDGVAPTATIGMPLPVNTTLIYTGSLSAIQLIETTTSAVCNISYYK